MNTQRKEAINAIRVKMETLKAKVEALRDQEQDHFYEMPDAEKAKNAIDFLDDTLNSLQDAFKSMTYATECI